MKKHTLLAVLFALPSSVFAQNLVLNPGFESSFTSWTRSGAASVLTSNFASGRRALRGGTGNAVVTQNIAVTPLSDYKFSAKAKLGAMSVSSKISLVLKTKSGGWLDEQRLSVSSTSYQALEKTIKMPAGAELAQVVIQKDSGSSYLYVDDLSLVKLAVTAPVTPPPTGGPAPVPVPVTSGYLPIGVGGGGALTGLSMSPYALLWFVGTDMGTLFRSTDLGASWKPVNHLQATFSSDLTLAVGVGYSADGTTVFHAVGGKLPKRSLDGGLTFTTMALPLEGNEYVSYWSSDSQNPNHVMAATNLGLWNTFDKGVTWTKVSGIAGAAMGTFVDLAATGKSIYHATANQISVSRDEGRTFAAYFIPTNVAIRKFAGGRDASGMTLVIGDNNGAQACSWVMAYLADWGQNSIDKTVSNCGYVWVSKDSGSFVRTTQTVGDHLKMAENDATTIYTTGARDWIRQYGTKVHVSRDKGASWTLQLNQINWDVIPYAAWPQDKIEYSAVALDVGWWDNGYESFAINARDSRTLGGTGYFFLHVTRNGGDNWLASFTEYADVGERAPKKFWKSRGLEVITAYKTRFHPTNPNLMYVAAADIGGLGSEDRGQSFRVIKAGFNSHYDYAFDADDDKVVYAAVGNQHDFPNEWYGHVASSNGGIYRSPDRGVSWVRLTGETTEQSRQYLSVGYDSTRNHLYAGTQEIGVLRSIDNGVTWSQFNAGLPAGNKIIPQIEVDAATGNVYALLTGDAPAFTNQAVTGIYFLNVSGGATQWQLLRGTVNYPPTADAGSKVWYYPTAFAVDPKNSNNLWLVDYENNRNWLMTGVWKSTDRGVTWNRVKQVTHATGLSLDPKDPNRVHVAGYFDLTGQWGEGGQLSSPDGGTTWFKNQSPALQKNARGVTVDPVDSNRIIYSYFGGGMLSGQNPFPVKAP
jgi:hypothetical protein